VYGVPDVTENDDEERNPPAPPPPAELDPPEPPPATTRYSTEVGALPPEAACNVKKLLRAANIMACTLE
jgi:hypothetical protein